MRYWVRQPTYNSSAWKLLGPEQNWVDKVKQEDAMRHNLQRMLIR